jgi:poly(hydroxyalkanoate) depolymerase family esterase
MSKRLRSHSGTVTIARITKSGKFLEAFSMGNVFKARVWPQGGRVSQMLLACALAALAAAWMSTMKAPARQNGLVEVTGFGSNPGNLRMFKYVPRNLPPSAPLVVAMHGCSQTAAAYDNETGWTKFADEWGFALVFPEQRTGNNGAGCFNWFEAGDNARDRGEALSIKQMTDKMRADHGVDAQRIFVTGLSAGGAMTSVMLATYPDVFAGGAIIAGIPYRCASGANESFGCLSGRNRTPQEWGNLVRGATSHAGPWPKVSIWHGTSDTTVNPNNANESMEQWTNVHGVDQTPDVQDMVKGYPHRVYQDAAGNAVVETYLITNMGHGVAIDPGPSGDQCGTPASFILDANICSSFFIGRFWGLDNADREPPRVAVVAPANGETVSGAVAIHATAADNAGVAKVEFYVDGRLLASDVTPDYQAIWDSSQAANGAHALTAKAFDAAGNAAVSATVTVNVTGGLEDVAPPTVNVTAPRNGNTVSGVVTLTAEAADDFGVTRVEFLVDGASIGDATRDVQTGVWRLQWNASAAPEGVRAISSRAFDARGNVGVDDDTSVLVVRRAFALSETFSDADGNGDLFDAPGWTVNGWESNADNVTAASPGGRSAFGYASSGVGCAGGLRTKTLSRSVSLGANPQLGYFRKLDLRAAINIFTRASFRVLVNGTAVDEKTVTNANAVESSWTPRSNISLAAFANQTVTLTFEISANSNVCLEVFAKALIDDVTIGDAATARLQSPKRSFGAADAAKLAMHRRSRR